MNHNAEVWKKAYKRLAYYAVRVIQSAQDAHLAMPENKLISMEMADLELLRIHGKRISEMDLTMHENEYQLERNLIAEKDTLE